MFFQLVFDQIGRKRDLGANIRGLASEDGAMSTDRSSASSPTHSIDDAPIDAVLVEDGFDGQASELAETLSGGVSSDVLKAEILPEGDPLGEIRQGLPNHHSQSRPETHRTDLQSPDELQSPPKKGRIRRLASGIGWFLGRTFDLVWWTILMAIITAVPVVQLLAYGYLLRVGGHLASGGKLVGSVPHLRAAGQIGLAITFLLIAAIPSRLFAHYEAVAMIVDPGGSKAIVMRILAVVAGFASLSYLLWAWARGGSVRHYLWPQPKRMLQEIWRLSFWKGAIDRLWDRAVELEMPSTFWLGLRGAAGTLIFLVPAMFVMAAFRNGKTGLAGLVGVILVAILGFGMQYLPMLQVHFASENRFRSLFQIRQIRRDFQFAPWSYFLAMLMGLIVFPIPLYLLKIEATPREVVWLPCLVFVAFMLPARIAEGLALRRARRLRQQRDDVVPTGVWNRISRWSARTLNLGVVAFYLLFVYVSQYTSWDGINTWVQQHAVLIPVPFLSGT